MTTETQGNEINHGVRMTSDRGGMTEGGQVVPAGTTVEYLGHVIGGMVKVKFSDETIDVMHPHCFLTLRSKP